MESEFSFEPNSKPKKFQKFNEDIILLNEDDSFAKKEIHEEINENPIFTLTIELEMGKTEKIDIFQNSDSYNIANDFCIEHKLFNISSYKHESLHSLLIMRKGYSSGHSLELSKHISLNNMI